MTDKTATPALPADRDDFEAVSEILRDITTRHYAVHGSTSQAPALVAVLCRTQLEGKPVVKLLPVDFLQSEEVGDRGKDLIAVMLSQLASHDDTLVVGYTSEAWMTSNQGIQPSADPQRKEVVVLNLISAECQALQVCPLTRAATGVSLEVGELQFMKGDTQLKGRFARNPTTSAPTTH